MTLKTDFKIIIPARYQSSRLPGKTLKIILDKPMIEHVYNRAQETTASEIIIATDDQRIFNTVEKFGGTAIMTQPDHQTGTDRIAEIINLKSWADDTIVVNLQGDEPHIGASLIQETAEQLACQPQCDIATLATRIKSVRDLLNPNMVKVTLNNNNEAMYFSRAAIPYNKKWINNSLKDDSDIPESIPYYHHIGLYAYTAGFLRQYPKLAACPNELSESLEQLRALCYGYRIFVKLIDKSPGHGVDTADDLIRIEKLMKLKFEKIKNKE